MRKTRTLEAEWRQVLRGSVSTGAKECESSTGPLWAAGFRNVTTRSRLARVLKIMNCLCLLIFQFLAGRGKPRVLTQ
jgi:hypothetical protein